jgi:hypothetical protein
MPVVFNVSNGGSRGFTDGLLGPPMRLIAVAATSSEGAEK